MLLTLDVGFGDLRKYRPGTHPGIILLRPASSGPYAVNQLLIGFLSAVDLSEFVESLVVVEPGRVRVRRPESGENLIEASKAMHAVQSAKSSGNPNQHS